MNKNFIPGQAFSAAGMFTLSLRLVTGWTYFSAFWRRLILDNKLDPDAAGYIGEKFNHFLPNALLIKPGIEYLVTHEQALWWSMLVFTVVEAVVGLLFILGFFTRLMSIGVTMLALGILLGAGWLGTTCLDEWQIGVLGIAAGFTIFLSGGGYYSLDNYMQQRTTDTPAALHTWLGSGQLKMGATQMRKLSLAGAIIITGLTLFTNQYFHGGVWGKQHNLSVKPNVQISDAGVKNGELSFTVFRNEGADVYGSFLVGVSLQTDSGPEVFGFDSGQLANMHTGQIHNEYVAKVKPGAHSLVIPLGAKARLKFKGDELQNLPPGTYSLVLTDISGLMWKESITIR